MHRTTALVVLKIATIVAAGLLARPAAAGDVHDSATYPTQWSWQTGASVADLNAKIGQGFRLIDLEVDQTGPLKFSAVFVKNSGIYASGWWWYYGVDADFVSEKLTQHGARLIDMESYFVNGERRFAVIMIPNNTAWWWLFGVPFNTVLDHYDAQKLPLDIDTYTLNGEQRFDTITRANTEDQFWAMYSNVDAAFVSEKLSQFNARLVDIEDRGNGKFTVIMHGNDDGKAWWWYYGMTSLQVSLLAAQNEARLVDVERYLVNGQPRFMVIMVDNETPSCPADLNGDNVVDGTDLGLLLGNWGCPGECSGDINFDGSVDGEDLGLLLAAWGQCFPV